MRLLMWSLAKHSHVGQGPALEILPVDRSAANEPIFKDKFMRQMVRLMLLFEFEDFVLLFRAELCFLHFIIKLSDQC